MVAETLTTGSDRWHLFAPAAATDQHGIKDEYAVTSTMHSNWKHLIIAMHTVRSQDGVTGLCCPLFSDIIAWKLLHGVLHGSICMVWCASSPGLVSMATDASSHAMHNDDVPSISILMIHNCN